MYIFAFKSFFQGTVTISSLHEESVTAIILSAALTGIGLKGFQNRFAANVARIFHQQVLIFVNGNWRQVKASIFFLAMAVEVNAFTCGALWRFIQWPWVVT